MGRRKRGNRSLLVISSVTVLTLALLAGVVFFLLPKITASGARQATRMTGQVNNAAHTINAAANPDKVVQGAVLPKQPVAATIKTNAHAKGNGNTAITVPATSVNNGNQAKSAPATMPQQNLTVPVVTLKQYTSNIRHMVAQSFNITDKALAVDLQNGMHLTNIANQQGLSNAQLQTLLANSITTSFQPAITTGNLTQAQVAAFIQQTQKNATTLEQQLSILPPPVAHW